MNFGRRLAKRSVGRWLWLDTYRCLRLPWKLAQGAAAAVAAPGDALGFRPVARSELRLYSNDLAYDFSARFLDELAARGDLCFGAFAGDKLVSYCFFALTPTAIDSHLRFHFPPQWIYVYKALTHPSWRGKRLQQRVFMQAMPEVRRWAQGTQEPLGFVTLVVADNTSSLSAFARLGFMPFESFPVLRVRSRPRLVSPPEEERTDFYVELTDKVRSGPA